MASSLPQAPFLYPIVDLASLEGRSIRRVVAELARGGARLLQFRAKDLPDGRFLTQAREALAAAREAEVPLLVNDRPDVAKIIGADGVHVGQDGLASRDVRALLGPGALIGLSTHSLEQLAAAEAEPVEYLAIGPIFQTRSKARADPAIGLETLRRARALTAKPLVAIGGITAGNAASVIEAGADGVAVISSLFRQRDLVDATRAFLRALESGTRA